MPIPFVQRPPTIGEFEKLRLLLSTFQDGTGQNRGGLLPGGRDFERVTAIVVGGEAGENKAIFDVQVPDPDHPATKYGLACKMRDALGYLDRTGRLTIEVSNSNKRFWAELARNGIDRASFRDSPSIVGELIVKLVEKWQEDVSLASGGDIDLNLSCYLVLTYDEKTGIYVVHQLPLRGPEPSTLDWTYPSESRLLALEHGEKVFEWYHEAGSQLKYFPRANSALWVSERFSLEQLPPDAEANSILARAQTYFPDSWARTNVE